MIQIDTAHAIISLPRDDNKSLFDRIARDVHIFVVHHGRGMNPLGRKLRETAKSEKATQYRVLKKYVRQIGTNDQQQAVKYDREKKKTEMTREGKIYPSLARGTKLMGGRTLKLQRTRRKHTSDRCLREFSTWVLKTPSNSRWSLLPDILIELLPQDINRFQKGTNNGLQAIPKLFTKARQTAWWRRLDQVYHKPRYGGSDDFWKFRGGQAPSQSEQINKGLCPDKKVPLRSGLNYYSRTPL